MKEKFLSSIKNAWGVFFELRLILFCSVVFLFLFGTLRLLYLDGTDIFQKQKSALVVEVFSRTDLDADVYPLLEEELRSLAGVKEVVSVSPQASLERLMQDPELEIDPQWLAQLSHPSTSSGLRQKKNNFLPWSYTLHLSQWDDLFLQELLKKIKDLSVGMPQKKAVLDVHVDQERWSLVSALTHYLSWIRVVLMTCIFFLFGFFIAVFARGLRGWKKSMPRGWEMSIALFAGILAGVFSYFLCLMVLAGSFFPGTIYWARFFGGFLLFQLLLSAVIVLAAFLHKRLSG